LTLETHGSLDEVVPALIARIGGANPEVNALVESRLRAIWAERTGDSWNDAPFGVDHETTTKPMGWKRWGSKRADPAPLRDSTAEWTAWWAGEQPALAQAGI
jgi:hypothetical protein